VRPDLPSLRNEVVERIDDEQCGIRRGDHGAGLSERYQRSR
jgi:hypothetical protein